MNITFWSFSKKENSTSIPSVTGTVMTCLIKSPSSILNPVIELKTNPTGYNYCYIADFGRYYFINDVVFDQGIWTCYCNVDVLGTYKTQIGSTSMYVLRAAYATDGEILDTLFPTKAETEISTVSNLGLSQSFEFNGFDNGYYIIGVQGYDRTSANGVIYYQLTPTQFVSLLTQFYANSGNNAWWGNLESGVRNALNKLSDYIISCRWFPVGFTVDDNSGTGYQLYLGSWPTTIYAPRVTGGTTYRQYFSSIPVHPQISYGNYVKSKPYSRYELVHPLTGTIELDSERMKKYGNKFEINITPDFTNGTARFEIMFETSSSPSVYKSFYVTYIHFGNDINLSGNDVNVSGLINAAAGVATSAITGNALGIAAGVASAINIGTSDPGHSTSSGGIANLHDPVLVCYFKIIANRDITNKGLPLCKVMLPSSIPGYILPDDPHVNIACTDDERRKINALLNGGFYYE